MNKYLLTAVAFAILGAAQISRPALKDDPATLSFNAWLKTKPASYQNLSLRRQTHAYNRYLETQKASEPAMPLQQPLPEATKAYQRFAAPAKAQRPLEKQEPTILTYDQWLNIQSADYLPKKEQDITLSYEQYVREYTNPQKPITFDQWVEWHPQKYFPGYYEERTEEITVYDPIIFNLTGRGRKVLRKRWFPKGVLKAVAEYNEKHMPKRLSFDEWLVWKEASADFKAGSDYHLTRMMGLKTSEKHAPIARQHLTEYHQYLRAQ